MEARNKVLFLLPPSSSVSGSSNAQVEEAEMPISQSILAWGTQCCWQPGAQQGQEAGAARHLSSMTKMQEENKEAQLWAGLLLFAPVLSLTQKASSDPQITDKSEWHQSKQNPTIFIQGKINSCLVARRSVFLPRGVKLGEIWLQWRQQKVHAGLFCFYCPCI